MGYPNLWGWSTRNNGQVERLRHNSTCERDWGEEKEEEKEKKEEKEEEEKKKSLVLKCESYIPQLLQVNHAAS